jgi:C4-dicarboxylate-specific signal transduction histidine kinase
MGVNCQIHHLKPRSAGIPKCVNFDIADVARPSSSGALVDITEARRRQDILAAAQPQLAHATRVAMLGEMNASIAHEVNQPLAAIAANAAASLHWLTGANPEVREATRVIRKIVKEVERASGMIQRICALARNSQPEMSKLDINHVVDEVIALIKQEAYSRRVSLRLDRARQLPPVHGDLIQLQQVIMNLVVNAIHAMASVTDRSRKLVIRTRQYDAHTVSVAVQDAGVGTDCADLDQLFSAFYSTKSNGMGLGLAISRSIIEAHHGRIWALRNNGPGMTFQFTVPTHRLKD